MNKLKIDFENKKTCVVVLNKSIAKTVLSSKKELVESVITRSLNWEDRENVLIKINRMSYWELKDFCISRQVPIMKTNPRWVKQQEIIQRSGIDRSFFSANSPAVINL